MAFCKKRDYIEKLRTEKGWTHSQLAERMGCTSTTSWNIENGAKEILNVTDIEDIAYAFELPSVKIFEMEIKYLNSKT